MDGHRAFALTISYDDGTKGVVGVVPLFTLLPRRGLLGNPYAGGRINLVPPQRICLLWIRFGEWQQCGSSSDRTEPNGTENPLEEKLNFRFE
jgi:hypothetical protein